VKGFWEKLEKVMMVIWVGLIPTQLGKHFWPEWSYVMGMKMDYLSPTLYILDVVWLGWWILNWKKERERRIGFKELIIGLFIGINIIFSASRWLAVYRWLRGWQWWTTIAIWWERKEELKKIVLRVLPVWLISETALAVGQIVKGGSLEGFWWWLGERKFSFVTLGIAQMSVWGKGVIRAYGTFSHPNSLAGFLVVALMMWLNSRKLIRSKLWWWTVWWMGVVGIMVSGSRTVWMITLGLLLWSFMRIGKNKKEVVGMVMIIVGLFSIVMAGVGVNYRTSDFLGGWDRDSLSKRINLNLAAIRMVRSHPLFGVGAGNFLVNLPEMQKNNSYFWLQPVHNGVLLVLAELGILGLIVAGLAASEIGEKVRIKKSEWMILIVIGLTAMVDHYWVTLPQNSWLLAIVISWWQRKKERIE
jgi:hypothetical protein